ncbi:M20/M25/M40 family metallo-hydrolase [Ferroacidibacillus organovorans]|uniref:Peptidase M20 dimerisation domain-containing protein n=2 Tax=Ferroacidibacillus organovorans TaxID=1765683 RepID=A0A162URP5_9BACL|nr:M20/M25/M40 family metallo-hydrolase [Ferroacidibacillus organovorans]KYP81988.1 hypothetical protein AYJ22_15635 [Ferroacidibacillus organovorans]OPG16633.1 hypothetical protein B2M26_07180 [Ferroacidibacillus organovorans]
MKAKLEVDQEALIADFMTLVSIGSLSREEANVAAYIRGVVEELGCTVEEDDAMDEVDGTSGNLIVRVSGDDSLPIILLMAHMDTVAPGNGVTPIRHEDRITSDGKTILGADDKAGVASILHALRVLRRTKENHPPLEIVFTVCEEVGLLGAKALDRSRLNASYGFCLDSGGTLGFVVAEGPAQAKLHARVYGKAAHAGVAPEKGISAIVVAAEAIAAMPLGRVDARTTANVGKIQGGHATNIVCDFVEFFAEARSLDAERLKAQQDAMSTALQEAATKYGVRVEALWTDSYPALHLPESSFLRTMITNAMAKLDLAPIFGPTGGGSDANVVAGKGIPIANLAVGYQQIHTLEEWIALRDLTLASELVLELIREGANHHSLV